MSHLDNQPSTGPNIFFYFVTQSLPVVVPVVDSMAASSSFMSRLAVAPPREAEDEAVDRSSQPKPEKKSRSGQLCSSEFGFLVNLTRAGESHTEGQMWPAGHMLPRSTLDGGCYELCRPPPGDLLFMQRWSVRTEGEECGKGECGKAQESTRTVKQVHELKETVGIKLSAVKWRM